MSEEEYFRGEGYPVLAWTEGDVEPRVKMARNHAIILPDPRHWKRGTRIGKASEMTNTVSCVGLTSTHSLTQDWQLFDPK